MGFLLCPNDSTGNDYDFAMWDVTGLQDPCSIFQGTGNVPPPIRCNFSTPRGVTTCCGFPSNYCSTKGLTGLDHTNPQPGILSYGAGGPPVMPGLNVTAGQTFLLLIDNWSNNNVGFTIQFYGTAQYFDATPPQLDSAYVFCSPSYDTQQPSLSKLRVRFDELINISSVAADGSDFVVVHNATSTQVPVTAAASVSPPQTNSVELTLGQLLVPGQSYTVYVGYNPSGSGSPNGQPGSDGNTISDQCGVNVPIANIPQGSGATAYAFTVPDTMEVQVTLTPPRCVGTPTGQIQVQATGPFAPYQYVLLTGSGTVPPTSGWSTTATWTNRAAGTYTVWVRDARGCIQRRVVQLPDPQPVGVVVLDSLLYTCGSGGFVRLEGTGGTGPYEFSVLPPYPTWQSNGYFGGLAAGTYTLRVRDANGCIATRTIAVQQAPALSAQVVTIDTVRCHGETGGFAVQGVGGTPPFSYALIGLGQANATGSFTGLPADTYWVEVRDGLGCRETLQVVLPQPDSLVIAAAQVIPSACKTTAQGAIQLTVQGGNPPYTFTWRDSTGAPLPATSDQLTGIPIGSYAVTITDRKGCTVGPVSYQVDYTYHAAVRRFSYEVVEDCPKKRLRYTVDVEGVDPLTFIWTWEDGTQQTTTQPMAEREYNPLQGGTLPVHVEVRSGGQCAVDTLVEIPFTACSGLLIPTAFTPNGDGINDLWYIQALGFKRYTLMIFDRWGAQVWTNGGDMTKFWNGRTQNGEEAPEGVYVFSFVGTDNNDKAVQRTGTVTLLR